MKQIAIYGAGNFGKIFYEALKQNFKIVCFIDDYSNEKFYDDIEIKKLSQINQDTEIYISVLQSSEKISKNLKKLNFEKIKTFQDSVLQNPKIFEILAKKSYLWLVDDKSKMYSEKLLKVEKLLKDEKSKKILNDFINFRKTLNPKYYVKPKDKEYLPKDIILFKQSEDINIVDCGAYIGDSLKDFIGEFKNVKNIYSFEPDNSNIEKLIKNVSSLKTDFPNINFIVYPSGVSNENKILSFSNAKDSSSSTFNEDSNISIPVVSLDKTLLGSDINYIKMDIEGSEKDALLGARDIIQKYKPKMAICLYHKPEDLWELPLLINEIDSTYDMYIRVHEDMFLSTVLYCVPKD